MVLPTPRRPGSSRWGPPAPESQLDEEHQIAEVGRRNDPVRAEDCDRYAEVEAAAALGQAGGRQAHGDPAVRPLLPAVDDFPIRSACRHSSRIDGLENLYLWSYGG